MLTVTWHVSVVERPAGTTGEARAPGKPGEQTRTKAAEYNCKALPLVVGAARAAAIVL